MSNNIVHVPSVDCTSRRGGHNYRRYSKMGRMKLAYFMMPLHNPTKDYHTALQEDIEAVLLADRVGFDQVWVGEHYSSRAEQIPAPLMFMASLADRAQQISFATGVLCLPQYHPAVVAGQAALFDHLLRAGGAVWHADDDRSRLDRPGPAETFDGADGYRSHAGAQFKLIHQLC